MSGGRSPEARDGDGACSDSNAEEGDLGESAGSAGSETDGVGRAPQGRLATCRDAVHNGKGGLTQVLAAQAARCAVQACGAAGESAAATSLLPMIAALEIPGRVEDVNEAVASVGGTRMVQHAIKNKGRLWLKLCRGYQFQAPVRLARKRSSDVLVRAKRRADGTWECQAVGIVNMAFAARSMADYLFPPGKEFEYGASSVFGSLEQELAGQLPSCDPYIPPAFFTRVKKPQAYGFRDNPFARNAKDKEIIKVTGTGEARIRRKWVPVSVVRFRDDGAVPVSPPAGAEGQLRAEDYEIVAHLRQVFDKRPIWLRGPLEERLATSGVHMNVTTMQKTLQMVAYLWSDGPWRNAYVRLGWDPRAPENAEQARKLQVIDFRDRFYRQPRAYFDAIEEQRSGGALELDPGHAVDHHFRTPPVNRSQLYQFADIEDSMVQRIIAEASSVQQVTWRNGWFTTAALRDIRERMAVRGEVMRRTKQASQLSLTGPSEGLALESGDPGAASTGEPGLSAGAALPGELQGERGRGEERGGDEAAEDNEDAQGSEERQAGTSASSAHGVSTAAPASDGSGCRPEQPEGHSAAPAAATGGGSGVSGGRRRKRRRVVD